MSNELPPLRWPTRLKAIPGIREMYWCDFPEDAQLPEFWKCRPVVIVSYRNTLSGAVTVIPCSTAPQPGNPWAVKLSRNIDGDLSTTWAICDKPTTVAVSRLTQPKNGKRKLAEAEFNQILAKLLEWLPKLQP